MKKFIKLLNRYGLIEKTDIGTANKRWPAFIILLSVMYFYAFSLAFAAIDLEDTGVAATTPYLSQADGLSTDLNGADQQISVSCWVFHEDDTASSRGLISKYDVGEASRQYRLSINSSDQIEFRLSNDGTASAASISTSTVSANTTYHFGGTYDDVNIQVYLNGAANGSATAYSSGIFNSDTRFILGTYSNVDPTVSTQSLDGTIDDVCVWNTAISAADMATIYNSKQKGMCAKIKTANLVLYCALDQCAEGTSCTADFNCYPGSPMSDTNTVTGASQRVLSYPPQGVQIS